MNILDIVLICIIVLVAILGFWKGFLNSLLSFVGNLLSIVAAFYLARPIATLLNNWFGATSSLGNTLTTQINPYFSEFSNQLGADVMANHCNASGFLKSAFNLFVNPETTYESNTALAQGLGNYAASIAMMAICMILAFILIRIAIFFLAKLFDSLKKKSLAFNGLDRTLGIVLGVAKGLVFIGIVCVIANLLQSIPAVANILDTVFEGSSIGKPFYDFVTNLVNNYLGNIDFNAMLSGMI